MDPRVPQDIARRWAEIDRRVMEQDREIKRLWAYRSRLTAMAGSREYFGPFDAPPLRRCWELNYDGNLVFLHQASTNLPNGDSFIIRGAATWIWSSPCQTSPANRTNLLPDGVYFELGIINSLGPAWTYRVTRIEKDPSHIEYPEVKIFSFCDWVQTVSRVPLPPDQAPFAQSVVLPFVDNSGGLPICSGFPATVSIRQVDCQTRPAC